MASVTLELHGPKHESKIPDKISYREQGDSPAQKASRCWNCFLPCWQGICRLVRNSFFLPYYNSVPAYHQVDERVAETAFNTLKLDYPAVTKEARLIRDHFDIREVTVKIKGSTTRIFTLQIFETKGPLHDKMLSLILFKFYGNREINHDGDDQNWDPMTIRELSESPLLIIKALRSQGVHVDSLLTTSLGAVTLSGLQYQISDDESNDLLPETLILNRSMASTRNVTSHLYIRPLNYILYGAAKIFGWNADPENDLLAYLGQRQSSNSRRKVIMLETPYDFYFSGNGGFDKDFHKKVHKLGVSVFRASLVPSEPIHTRAHHALPLNHMVFNAEANVMENTDYLPMNENENMSSFLVKNVLLAGKGKRHTCFIACGNDATTFPLVFQRDAKSIVLTIAKELKAQTRLFSETKDSRLDDNWN